MVESKNNQHIVVKAIEKPIYRKYLLDVAECKKESKTSARNGMLITLTEFSISSSGKTDLPHSNVLRFLFSLISILFFINDMIIFLFPSSPFCMRMKNCIDVV